MWKSLGGVSYNKKSIGVLDYSDGGQSLTFYRLPELTKIREEELKLSELDHKFTYIGNFSNDIWIISGVTFFADDPENERLYRPLIYLFEGDLSTKPTDRLKRKLLSNEDLTPIENLYAGNTKFDIFFKFIYIEKTDIFIFGTSESDWIQMIIGDGQDKSKIKYVSISDTEQKEHKIQISKPSYIDESNKDIDQLRIRGFCYSLTAYLPEKIYGDEDADVKEAWPPALFTLSNCGHVVKSFVRDLRPNNITNSLLIPPKDPPPIGFVPPVPKAKPLGKYISLLKERK